MLYSIRILDRIELVFVNATLHIRISLRRLDKLSITRNHSVHEPRPIIELPTSEPVAPLGSIVLVSLDVETTATSPEKGDVVSIGACTYWPEDESRLDTFYDNVLPVTGRQDPNTMKWWEQWPERWAETQVNPSFFRDATAHLTQWLRDLGATPIFMAWPAHFDFGFMDKLFIQSEMPNPFGYKPLDQNSFMAGLLGDWKAVVGSRSKGTLNIPDSWEGENPTPHNALADAIAQRNGFIQMLKDKGLI